MKSRLNRRLLTGGLLLALSSMLMTLPKRATVTTAAQMNNAASKATVAESDNAARIRISEAYGKLPLSFEENHGQAGSQVKFLSRGPNYALLLTPNEAVLSLHREKPADSDSGKAQFEKHEMQSAVLRMKLVGAKASPQMEGRDQLTGKSNYLIGRQKNWHTDIPTYAQVKYDDIYPGIDLVYYGNQRRLEYDFVVAPGADTSAIRLDFDGANEMNLEADGSLRLKMKGGDVTQPAPVIYQQTPNGEKQTIAGHYVLNGNEVAFEISDYDRSRELVIDPQILYATFYGGSGFEDPRGLAVDGNGSAYIAGITSSHDLLLINAFQGNFPAAAGDVSFIVKLNPSGTAISYATYFGDSEGSADVNAIAVTSDGKACVTGLVGNQTNDSDFPTTPGRFQGNGVNFLQTRGLDAFMTVFQPQGNALFYSTFYAGNGIEEGLGIAVDAANLVYITGSANVDVPTKNAFQSQNGQPHPPPFNEDAFIAKFNPALSGNDSLIYSSLLGGAGTELGQAIAVTPGGVAFVAGVTGSFNYPTKSSSSLPALQTVQGGVNDGFIAKVSPTGALIYSTYFGGNGADTILAIAVDSAERAYVSGETQSSNLTFPLKNPFDSTASGTDAFVAKINADGTALFYSSFLGGLNFDSGQAIATDAAGNAYVAGQTGALSGFPIVNGFPSSVPAGTAFLAKIEASDTAGATVPKILYSDSFGGNGAGHISIALDPRGNVYLAGQANGTFTTTPGAFQETFKGGGTDGFVTKIGGTFPDSIGTFRPPANPRQVDDFRLRNSNTAGPPDLTVDFGQLGDQPLAGDWNGDGVDDVGVFRPSTAQFLLRQPTRLLTGIVINVTITMSFGFTGDKAVVGDWNGDGIDTPGVFHNNSWLLTNGPNTSNSTPPIDLLFNFGSGGDTPVAGDWNGDGIDTVGVFHLDTGCTFFLSNNNTATDIVGNGFCTVAGETPLPVAGDWNGDGVDSVGVYSTSLQRFFLSDDNATTSAFNFGESGDLPIAGDWDGKVGNTPPNSGINSPADGSSRVAQTQVFTTTCSDPDGWHDIGTIDFKITRSNGNGQGVPIALWAQFDENHNLIRLYDPDLQTWREGAPGSNLVLENGYVQLNLAGTSVQGSGPLGPSVQVRWQVVFKNPAAQKNYKQYLNITDDHGASTGFDDVGSWSVLK